LNLGVDVFVIQNILYLERVKMQLLSKLATGVTLLGMLLAMTGCPKSGGTATAPTGTISNPIDPQAAGGKDKGGGPGNKAAVD
jgi:hypothetical protein